MEQTLSSISSSDLYVRLGSASAPIVVVVRLADDLIAIDRPVIACRVHGQNVRRGAASELIAVGCGGIISQKDTVSSANAREGTPS
jgi:hypothetical protein